MLGTSGKFAVALVAILIVGAASAHEGATGVVKERMEKMERYDELLDRVFAMVHGELNYDAATVRRAVAEIGDTAGNYLTELFPAGSDGPPSKALPAIWQDYQRFQHLAEMMGVLAKTLADSADRRDPGFVLPKKWEEARMGPGMMQGQGRGRGMMQGQGRGRGMMQGMMGEAPSVEAAAFHVAAHCNACHALYRAEE